MNRPTYPTMSAFFEGEGSSPVARIFLAASNKEFLGLPELLSRLGLPDYLADLGMYIAALGENSEHCLDEHGGALVNKWGFSDADLRAIKSGHGSGVSNSEKANFASLLIALDTPSMELPEWGKQHRSLIPVILKILAIGRSHAYVAKRIKLRDEG